MRSFLGLMRRQVCRVRRRLRPAAAERARCLAIAAQATGDPLLFGMALHCISEGLTPAQAAVELQALAAEREQIRSSERTRITTILRKSQAGQERLACKLVDNDTELFDALNILKQDREVGAAVNAIFADADGGEDCSHGMC